MHCQKGIACAVSALLLLSACTSATRARVPAPTYGDDAASHQIEVLPRQGVDSLVIFSARVVALPPAALRAEYVAATEMHRRAPDPTTRFKLAILYGLKQAPFRDEARARQLLRAIMQDVTTSDGIRALSEVWLYALNDRTTLVRALDDERKQRHMLQQQLEQLKTIEEEIDRRPRPPVVPAR